MKIKISRLEFSFRYRFVSVSCFLSFPGFRFFYSFFESHGILLQCNHCYLEQFCMVAPKVRFASHFLCNPSAFLRFCTAPISGMQCNIVSGHFAEFRLGFCAPNSMGRLQSVSSVLQAVPIFENACMYLRQ